MDTLAAMRVFAAVVETGGLSAAGRALGLAPSSVSRRIGELEGRLGVRLLQRTTRKLSLTEAGATYYERARDIVRAVEDATLAVSETRAGPGGILRVTVPSSIARLHLVAAVAAFQSQFDAVRVVLSVTDRIADLVGEGLDVAIRVGALEDSSLMARKVGEAR
ncbi:MAG: LysR family transcriptional regulator, partial [Kiloniellales bacterium]|nr:LysR family transcriptional regulator [Kiloniellales bacterium]